VDEIRDRENKALGPDKLYRPPFIVVIESQRMAGHWQNRLNLAYKRDAIALKDVEQQINTFFR
jgi:hypothetical protein